MSICAPLSAKNNRPTETSLLSRLAERQLAFRPAFLQARTWMDGPHLEDSGRNWNYITIINNPNSNFRIFRLANTKDDDSSRSLLPVCFKQISLDRWTRAPFFEYQPFSSVPPIWRAASLFGSQQDAWSSNQVVVPTLETQALHSHNSCLDSGVSTGTIALLAVPVVGVWPHHFEAKELNPWVWTTKNIQSEPAATPPGLIAGQQTRSHHNLLTTNHWHHMASPSPFHPMLKCSRKAVRSASASYVAKCAVRVVLLMLRVNITTICLKWSKNIYIKCVNSQSASQFQGQYFVCRHLLPPQRSHRIHTICYRMLRCEILSESAQCGHIHICQLSQVRHHLGNEFIYFLNTFQELEAPGRLLCTHNFLSAIQPMPCSHLPSTASLSGQVKPSPYRLQPQSRFFCMKGFHVSEPKELKCTVMLVQHQHTRSQTILNMFNNV